MVDDQVQYHPSRVSCLSRPWNQFRKRFCRVRDVRDVAERGGVGVVRLDGRPVAVGESIQVQAERSVQGLGVDRPDVVANCTCGRR